MKVTKKQLRRIIREALEDPIKRFDETVKGADPALSSYIKAMSRAPSDAALEDMAKLWSALVAAPGDIAGARAIASSLNLSSGLASFHARKVKAGTDYPTGAELKEIVHEMREALIARRRAAPPHRPARKPYGGGTRNRPWDQST